MDVNDLSQAAFADRSGLAPSVISQLLNGHRNLGDALARKIEENIGIKRGWLDIPHDVISSAAESPQAANTYMSSLGKVVYLTPQEERLLALFAQMPESEKVHVIDNLHEKSKEYNTLLTELLALKNKITPP